MILFFNPRATRPKNRRYPLSILAMAAMFEGKEEYAIVDGNLDDDPRASIDRIMQARPARLLAVTVMPGPQMVAAIPVCRGFKREVSRGAGRLGRLFPVALSRRRAECELCGFRRARARAKTPLSNFWPRSKAGANSAASAALVQRRVRTARAQCRAPAALARRFSLRCRIIAWTLRNTCCRRFWARARRCIRRASAVRSAAISAAWCDFSGSREKMEPPERTAAILAICSANTA